MQNRDNLDNLTASQSPRPASSTFSPATSGIFSRFWDWGFSSSSQHSSSPASSSPVPPDSVSEVVTAADDARSNRRLSITSVFTPHFSRDSDNLSIKSTQSTASRISSFLPSRRKLKNRDTLSKKDGVIEQWKSAIKSIARPSSSDTEPDRPHINPLLQYRQPSSTHLSTSFRSYGAHGRTTPDLQRLDDRYITSSPTSAIMSAVGEDDDPPIMRSRGHSFRQRERFEDNSSVTSASTAYYESANILTGNIHVLTHHQDSDVRSEIRSVSPTTLTNDPQPTFSRAELTPSTPTYHRLSVHSNGSGFSSADGNNFALSVVSNGSVHSYIDGNSVRRSSLTSGNAGGNSLPGTISRSIISRPSRMNLSLSSVIVKHSPMAVGGVITNSVKWYELDRNDLGDELFIFDDIENAQNLKLMKKASKVGKIEGSKFVVDVSQLGTEEVKRQEVIFELLYTEREYVRDINIIIELFMRKIREKNIFNTKQINIVFSNIEQLLPVNQELLAKIEERRRESFGVVQSIGDIFVRVSQFLKIYTTYCGNQPEAAAFLIKQKHNSTLQVFLQYCQMQQECRGLDIHSFLLKPVQRICKYPLLLKQLLKHTPTDHLDHDNLVQATDLITHVVDVVNERRRFVENQYKMLNSLSKLEFPDKTGLPNEPSRRFIHEGTLLKYSPGSALSIRTHQRLAILFSDCFVLAKPSIMRGGKAQVGKVFQVASITLQNLADTEKYKHSFEISIQVNGEVRSAYFCAHNEAEKSLWMESLSFAITEASQCIRPSGVISINKTLLRSASSVRSYSPSRLAGSTAESSKWKSNKPPLFHNRNISTTSLESLPPVPTSIRMKSIQRPVVKYDLLRVQSLDDMKSREVGVNISRRIGEKKETGDSSLTLRRFSFEQEPPELPDKDYSRIRNWRPPVPLKDRMKGGVRYSKSLSDFRPRVSEEPSVISRPLSPTDLGTEGQLWASIAVSDDLKSSDGMGRVALRKAVSEIPVSPLFDLPKLPYIEPERLVSSPVVETEEALLELTAKLKPKEISRVTSTFEAEIPLISVADNLAAHGNRITPTSTISPMNNSLGSSVSSKSPAMEDAMASNDSTITQLEVETSLTTNHPTTSSNLEIQNDANSDELIRNTLTEEALIVKSPTVITASRTKEFVVRVTVPSDSSIPQPDVEVVTVPVVEKEDVLTVTSVLKKKLVRKEKEHMDTDLGNTARNPKVEIDSSLNANESSTVPSEAPAVPPKEEVTTTSSYLSPVNTSVESQTTVDIKPIPDHINAVGSDSDHIDIEKAISIIEKLRNEPIQPVSVSTLPEVLHSPRKSLSENVPKVIVPPPAPTKLSDFAIGRDLLDEDEIKTPLEVIKLADLLESEHSPQEKQSLLSLPARDSSLKLKLVDDINPTALRSVPAHSDAYSVIEKSIANASAKEVEKTKNMLSPIKSTIENISDHVIDAKQVETVIPRRKASLLMDNSVDSRKSVGSKASSILGESKSTYRNLSERKTPFVADKFIAASTQASTKGTEDPFAKLTLTPKPNRGSVKSLTAVFEAAAAAAAEPVSGRRSASPQLASQPQRTPATPRSSVLARAAKFGTTSLTSSSRSNSPSRSQRSRSKSPSSASGSTPAMTNKSSSTSSLDLPARSKSPSRTSSNRSKSPASISMVKSSSRSDSPNRITSVKSSTRSDSPNRVASIKSSARSDSPNRITSVKSSSRSDSPSRVTAVKSTTRSDSPNRPASSRTRSKSPAINVNTSKSSSSIAITGSKNPASDPFLQTPTLIPKKEVDSFRLTEALPTKTINILRDNLLSSGINSKSSSLPSIQINKIRDVDLDLSNESDSKMESPSECKRVENGDIFEMDSIGLEAPTRRSSNTSSCSSFSTNQSAGAGSSVRKSSAVSMNSRKTPSKSTIPSKTQRTNTPPTLAVTASQRKASASTSLNVTTVRPKASALPVKADVKSRTISDSKPPRQSTSTSRVSSLSTSSERRVLTKKDTKASKTTESKR